MAKTKISTIAKTLNVGLPTVFEFLSKKGITIDETPNTRVEQDVVDILVKEFDKDGKYAASAATPAAPAPAEKTAAKEEAPQATNEARQKLNILGKIDLNAPGHIITEKPAKEEAPAPKPKPEAKAEPKAEAESEPKPAAPVAPAPKPEPAPVAKAEAKPEPKAEVKPEPKAEAKPEPKAEAKPEPKAEAKARPDAKENAPAQETDQAKDDEANNFIPTQTPKGPSVNIIGKIDLDALNQSTRPRKKGKEDRRGQSSQGAGTGDRKKRRRINGKEKVDIEKTGQQAARDSRQNASAAQGGGKNRRSEKSSSQAPATPKRPIHQ